MLPAASDMCKTMFGNGEYINKLKITVFGHNTCYVDEMAFAKAFALQ